jgi:phosphoglycolate phosphatase
MESKRLIIFDFDGVVVDSLAVYEGTVMRCLNKIGQPIVKNRNDFLELFENNFYTSLVRKGVDLTAFMDASTDILAQVNYDDMKLFDELIPVLAKLQTANIMVIISSSDTNDINLIMKRFHLNGYFRDILGSDVNFSKRAKILHAVDKFGVERENTYYVGDTTGDIKEAKTAGIKTIAVSWGWHSREQLSAVCPDHLIDHPEELLEIR